MRSLKWQKCYTGPYLITRKIKPAKFVLQKSEKAKFFVVHLNKLKACHGPTPTSWLEMSSTGAKTSAQDVRRNKVLTSDASQLPVHASVPDFMCNSDGDHSSPLPVCKLPVWSRSRPQYLANYIC